MSRWEDKLIEEMQTRRQASLSVTSPALDPMLSAFASMCAQFDRSIGKICEATGASVEHRGDVTDHRVRWGFGSRSLVCRVDMAAGKLFVTVDLGNSLAIEELVMDEIFMVDARGRRVSHEDLSERFVTLLFKGKV